jgi:hypothetical protein
MRQVFAVVGAVVGAYIGSMSGNTAQGAQIGWAIGSAIGNAVDPLVIRGPSIGDIAQQTSQEGVPRPIVFALSQPISGNIVACSEPKIITHRNSQGKGGPVTTSQSVLRTYAVGICEGPITAVMRVWTNGKLVYDVRPGHENANNPKFLQNAKIFLGTFDQMPSAELEALFGVGNVPAMRGTAYIAWHDIDLTNQGGAVPQYTFQVLRCEGTIYTSELYDQQNVESLSFAMVPGDITIHTQQVNYELTEGMRFAMVPGDITIHSTVVPYSPLESVSFTMAPGDITIHTIVKNYTDPPEQLTFGMTPGDITINTIVIPYSDTEALTFGMTPGNITITTH